MPEYGPIPAWAQAPVHCLACGVLSLRALGVDADGDLVCPSCESVDVSVVDVADGLRVIQDGDGDRPTTDDALKTAMDLMDESPLSDGHYPRFTHAIADALREAQQDGARQALDAAFQHLRDGFPLHDQLEAADRIRKNLTPEDVLDQEAG